MSNTPLSISTRNLLRIALPISLGSLVQFVVVLTDNFFLSRSGELELNGAGNAALVYLTFVMVLAGGSMGIQILVARHHGAGQTTQMSEAARTGRVALLGLGILLAGMVLGVNALGGWEPLMQSQEVRNVFVPFLSIRAWGLIPYALLMALEGDWIGQAKTRPLLPLALLMASINMALDAFWVEGLWGGPVLGADGAALASLIAETTGALVALAYAKFRLHPASFAGTWSMDRAALKQWWKLSTPVMAQFGLTIGTWASFFFFVERVGMMELKVSHLTRNAFMLAFVVCTGVGQTVRTVVSNLIGEGRQHDLQPALLRLLVLSYLGVGILTHGYLLYPDWIASHFFSGPSSEAGLNAMSETLGTAFVAVQLYAASAVAIAVLQGAGFTKHAFWVELTSVTAYILLAYFMTLVVPQPIHVIWRADWLYFGGILAGSMLCLKLLPWRDGSADLGPS